MKKAGKRTWNSALGSKAEARPPVSSHRNSHARRSGLAIALGRHNRSISHEQMEERTGELYLKFDQDRKMQEATEADRLDEADLKALETKIKRRPKK